MSKKPRAATPAQTRKSAAVESFKKEFGRDPVGRASAAHLEKRVLNAQQTKVRADAPRPQPSFKPMASSVSASSPSPSRFAGMGKAITPALLGVSVGAAAVQGYHRSRDHGDSVGVAAAKGAVSALPAAFVAAAPQIERGAAKFAATAFGIGDHIVRESGMFDFVLGWPLLKLGGASVLAGGVAKGIEKAAKFAGKAALPAAIGVGALTGAMRDENRLRGAARGAVSALDPTALFMNKGLAERGFNAAFGEQDRPQSQQPILNRQNPGTDDYRGKGGLTRHSETRLSTPKSNFAAADKTFSAGRKQAAAEAENHRRGFQNPQNLYAALRAQGASTANVASF